MTMGSELTWGVFLPRAVKDNMADARLMEILFVALVLRSVWPRNTSVQ